MQALLLLVLNEKFILCWASFHRLSALRLLLLWHGRYLGLPDGVQPMELVLDADHVRLWLTLAQRLPGGHEVLEGVFLLMLLQVVSLIFGEELHILILPFSSERLLRGVTAVIVVVFEQLNLALQVLNHLRLT